MMYAQYYHLVNGVPQQAIGSDSVYVFDGRLSPYNRHYKAIEHAEQLNKSLNKGYVGYAMYQGESFTRSKPTVPFLFAIDVEHIDICNTIEVRDA